MKAISQASLYIYIYLFLMIFHSFLQLSAQQRQPPHHKESNGLGLSQEDGQSQEEMDAFLPRFLECETAVWRRCRASGRTNG